MGDQMALSGAHLCMEDVRLHGFAELIVEQWSVYLQWRIFCARYGISVMQGLRWMPRTCAAFTH
jgi:hypothetical protein